MAKHSSTHTLSLMDLKHTHSHQRDRALEIRTLTLSCRYPTPLDPRQTCKPPSPVQRSPSESSQHFLNQWGRHCRDRRSTQSQEVRPIERRQGTSRQHASALTLANRPLCDPVLCSSCSFSWCCCCYCRRFPFSPRIWCVGRAPLPICDSCA